MLIVLVALPALAAEPCRTIHGRFTEYTGDGQQRIWQIGTNHEFSPRGEASEKLISRYVDAGGFYEIFGDFELCPTEPRVKGSVQGAILKNISHAKVLPRTYGVPCQKQHGVVTYDGTIYRLRTENKEVILDDTSVSYEGAKLRGLVQGQSMSGDFTICSYAQKEDDKKYAALVKVAALVLAK